MNAPHPPSLLAGVQMAPRDPILGLTEAYNADKNPKKVNLGVGVYTGDDGKVPLLECVRRAERQLVEQPAARNYLPIDGLAAYDKVVQSLVFGADSAALKEGRIVTVQSLGGTGGLRVGADFLRRTAPDATLWISDPSWENHRAVFESAGFKVNTYPYYDANTRGVDFDAMLGALKAMPAGDIVLLHACCHNPTGVDLSEAQWAAVAETIAARGLVPFLDIAYQGFGDGIDADGSAVRLFAQSGLPLFVANSFSKSFSLYGERVGSLSVVAASSDERARVLSQIKRLVRSNYSNPPTHGGQIVATVLTTPELRTLWEQELGHMRERIKSMRKLLVEKIHARVPGADFSFVTRQRGMFSYSGLTKEQVVRMREEFAVYAIESGRICVAALNTENIDYSADAIAKVIG
ncbi:MAG: aromatic amino acid aminotransferase [Betaproteobacteria bacterium RIFCSPLOWO2_12_FULL_62_13b]|nr:MAG: aromatic amino acid aminotransferase [Betaproteobacteria bacterium RIFCSPLOWO2_12_FULL_62_13b]